MENNEPIHAASHLEGLMNLTHRIATSEDAASIAALVNSAYRGEASRAGWTTEADLLDGQRTDVEAVEEIILKQNAVFLIFFSGEEMLGCVLLERHSVSVYLGMLTVKPGRQGTGIGNSMIEVAENWVSDVWKVKRIELAVISKRHELIAWYVRKGYYNTQRVEPFPYGNERFGIPKVDDLEFVILEKMLA